VSVRSKLWTREEYERLVTAGAFLPDAHVQLIDGEIVEMTPQSAAHATALLRLHAALTNVFPGFCHVRAQLLLAISTWAEPEPDISVVPGPPDDYRDHHPVTAMLLVEVADTSLEFDRTRKAALYAQARVPEYWILNLVDRQLEVLRNPQETGYVIPLVLQPSDFISPSGAPNARIQVSSLLP